MKTLMYGAGPIGRWLALRMQHAGQDVTLLARNDTFRSLERSGIEIIDGLTGERLVARVKLVDRLDPEEISALVDQRHLVHDAHHCPHGRPTALIFSREELDKQFKRT